MPSLEESVPFWILGFFAIGLGLERIFAARALPRVRGWFTRAGVVFVSTMTVNALVPALLAAQLGGHTPLDLSGLGLWGGGAVAFVFGDFCSYWLHRAQHRSPRFWRWTHQIHHSAERVDVIGAAFFHPFDIGVQAAVSTFAVWLLGVTPDAAALAGIATVLLAVFQHLNVRTPVALGYLIQRPEAHAVHHERGVHAYNYGNLACWDFAFGTFRNPREFPSTAGFYDGASRRLGAMLIGRDVSRPA